MTMKDILGRRRMRRTRQSDWSRRLVRENHLTVNDLIWPLFLIDGNNLRDPIASMPGVHRLSVDQAVEAAREAQDLGIPAILPFPYTGPDKRDETGSEALNPNNLVCQAARAIKEAGIDVGIITDAALDPFTSHGHDGVMEGDVILNDETVEILTRQSVLQAEAGADVISPSDMMDGRVGAIRDALDDAGHQNVQILAYSAKYASAIYSPFRDALGSTQALKGDKQTYQMDPSNGDEALREIELDIEEGADMIMVKPGLFYLDIVRRAKDAFAMPTYAYQVSGEYSMISAAGLQGWIDRDKVMMEGLIAFKRAGADGILTYFAPDVARKLNGD